MAATTDSISTTDQDQPDRSPLVAPAAERAATKQVAQALGSAPAGPAKLVTADGQEITLPATLLRVLRLSADLLADDRAVLLDSLGRHITPAQAAEVLGFPLDYVMELLDSGELPSERDHTVQRLLLSNVLEYQQAVKQRHEALDELTRLSEEIGLYDFDTNPIKPRRLLAYEEEDRTGERSDA